MILIRKFSSRSRSRSRISGGCSGGGIASFGGGRWLLLLKIGFGSSMGSNDGS